MIKNLKNCYLLMRHGHSLANEAGLIISHPEDGIDGWGLAAGACNAIQSSIKGFNLTSDSLFLSSPFRRALETARCASALVSSVNLLVVPELRERYFGSFDKTSDINYEKIWQKDAENSRNSAEGVESPLHVFQRLTALMEAIEGRYESRVVVLVSHGDPLNILMTGYAGLEVGRHRNVNPVKTSELRILDHQTASSKD